VREPKLFLMDEPLSNLDAKLRVQTRAEISRLQRRLGITTMYVTHDQVEAMTMGDRVAVLRRGHLMQCASPQELYHTPDNLFVATFIGSPSMNVVQAKVVENGDRPALAIGSQTLHLDDAALQRLPGVRSMIEQLSGRAGSGLKREKSLATVASLVGALVLARAVNDPKLSDDILRATRTRLAE
jgi:multiple sugar transport system ATP-binding protein